LLCFFPRRGYASAFPVQQVDMCSLFQWSVTDQLFFHERVRPKPCSSSCFTLIKGKENLIVYHAGSSVLYFSCLLLCLLIRIALLLFQKDKKTGNEEIWEKEEEICRGVTWRNNYLSALSTTASKALRGCVRRRRVIWKCILFTLTGFKTGRDHLFISQVLLITDFASHRGCITKYDFVLPPRLFLSKQFV
jgi:hypothetical protein